jgi:paraquat-inducible protein A
MTNRAGAFDRTLAGAFASLILMASAIFFPFLELSVVGLRHRASLLDAILAFSSGLALPLSLATALLIVIIPLIRAIALAYTILPLRMGRTPAPSAERAFRLAAHLRPWSMAEVFIIGAAVALVKVSGMASVSLGTGFWAMAFLVVVVIYEGTSLCERTVWQTLERQRAV